VYNKAKRVADDAVGQGDDEFL